MQDAGRWAKKIIRRAMHQYDKYLDPVWVEYPLIQRDPISLRGEHLNIYGKIRSNPTADLYHLCRISGFHEDKFFGIINDLIRDNYLRILSTYFSINLNEYVEPLFKEFLAEKIRARRRK